MICLLLENLDSIVLTRSVICRLAMRALYPAHDGYPFATVSVFLTRSSDLQQYQLATEA